MPTTKELASHFNNVHFGGNWTCVNLKDTLSDVSWQQATTQTHDFNTIATLTYHIYYFVKVAKKVLQGGPLEGNDKLSFDHPPISNQQDWDNFLALVFADAEVFAELVEQLPEEQLYEDFADKKYGSYYRNIAGIIEHTHYHIGQIVIIKKLLSK